MKALSKSVIFSRREKLLLGLLGSALLFSFSFSYGAVNQAKVDSIMQTINTAANNFSSQADRDTYYQRVYTGLSDAIDMLAVVRNNVGAMIGTAPVDVVNPGNNAGTECTDQNVNYTRTVNGSSLISTPNYDLTMKNGETLSIEVIDGNAIGKFPGYSFPGMNIYWGSRDMPGARDFSISKCKGDFSNSAQILYRAEDESTQGAGYFYILSNTETAQPSLPNRSYKAVRQNTKGRWYINIRQKYCGLASSGITSCTLFYSLGSSGPNGGTPPVITNPIADYPIPPPCPAGVKIMKEIATGIAAPRMTVYDMTAYPSGIIYKLPTPLPGGGRLEVVGNSYGLGNINSYTKISPYPCDFYLGPEEDPDTNAKNACVVSGGMVQFTITTGPFFWKRRTDDTLTCNLQQGQTYYINMIPRQSSITKNKIPKNPPNAPSGILTEFRGPDGIDKYWGIYDTFEEYAATRTTQNSTSENPETLRQKVVNDYATKGVNTDVVPLRRADGTIVATSTGVLSTGVSPGGTSTPVIVREGPWERVEDIFCPDTKEKLQSEYGSFYNYYNQGNTYWNVKDYQKPSDISLPATCTTGKKFVKHGMTATCYVYECKN